MPIIGATELQPVNILGQYVQGMEAGRAAKAGPAWPRVVGAKLELPWLIATIGMEGPARLGIESE